jgi:L-lactate dehydrogenase (cytochrome)
MSLDSALTIDDLKAQARAKVPRMFFDYSESGSWTETTFHANETEFGDIAFRQRVAVSLENRSLRTTVVGHDLRMPVAGAPAAICGLQTANGEIHAAHACEQFGIPFSLSTMSICSIEQVAEAASRPFWFQIYVLRDKPFMERLIDRAKAAGCSALILTMDLQILGQRHADIRNGLSAPPKLNLNSLLQIATRPRWALGMLGAKSRTFANVVGHAADVEDLSSLSSWIAGQFDLALSWKEVSWVRDRFDGPVIVKGILDADDARQAVAHGADAIVVSNHGGRQLDGAPSSIRVLAEIVEAIGDRAELLMDGGIRSGQDVLKALALGARGTLVGRPLLYGLGAGGEAGVARALAIIEKEMNTTLALLGERDIRDVGAHNIHADGLNRRRTH